MNENTPIPLVSSSRHDEIILYQPDSTVKLEVRLENDSVWLTQQQIADLFGTKRPAISVSHRVASSESQSDVV